MTISESLKQKYLTYYHKRVEEGSKTSVADTLKQFKKLRRSTLNTWISQEKDNPSKEAPKDNTNITIREIIAEKELDKQFNEGEGGRIQNIPTENVAKHLFEKYPKRAKELLDKNYEWALDLTFKELEVGIPNKDIEALKEGYSLSDILTDKRKPLTIDDNIEQTRKEQELSVAKMDNIVTGEQLDTIQKAFENPEKQIEAPQFKKFFDMETMDSLKLLLEFQALLPSLTPQQQAYYKKKFMIERGLSIFPLLERILYSNIEIQQEPQIPDEEINDWWVKIPMNERRVLLNRLNGQ